MKTRNSTLAAAVLFVIAACSGGGDVTTTVDAPADTTTTAVPSDTTSTTSTPESTAGATITIASFSFGSPMTVTVGEEVRVVNQDGVPHTWTSTDGLFDSGSLSGGQEFIHTFGEAGEYDFFCGVHPEMTGSITVEN